MIGLRLIAYFCMLPLSGIPSDTGDILWTPQSSTGRPIASFLGHWSLPTKRPPRSQISARHFKSRSSQPVSDRNANTRCSFGEMLSANSMSQRGRCKAFAAYSKPLQIGRRSASQTSRYSHSASQCGEPAMVILRVAVEGRSNRVRSQSSDTPPRHLRSPASLTYRFRRRFRSSA